MRIFKQNSNVFNLLSEGVSEGILVVNQKRIIVASNSSAEDMFGYKKDELLGMNLNVLIPEKYHSRHNEHVESFIHKSEKRKMGHGKDLYGIRKDKEEFPVEVGLNPFELYGGTYVMALVIDITLRKKQEIELSHWARIFKESLNEIYVFDAKTLLFTDVNKAAQKNMGYSLDDFKKLTPLDIKPEFDHPNFQLLIKPLLEKETEKIRFETLHKRKDGSTYPAEIHLQLSSKGEKEVFVAIIMDITERKNYTQKLEKTVEERTRQLTEALAKEKELSELKTR
ncbi:MAG: PAS domain-containing protein, partial [Flavobacteriaceae bacterium]